MIRDLLPFLYSDGEVQKVFSPPPIVSYRSARKIKDYIVGSKLYPVERKVECWGCGSSRCQVCKNISITEEFTSFTTKKTYKINNRFDCNDKCSIYLLSCTSCGKQHVGNILEAFRIFIRVMSESWEWWHGKCETKVFAKPFFTAWSPGFS